MSEIKFVELKCQRCGGELEEKDGNFVCVSCGKKWQKENLNGFTDMLEACEEALRAQRVADIANLRRLLWAETHKEFVSNIQVERLCADLQKYLPQDFYADFYMATCSRGKTELGDFLYNVNVKERYDDIPLVMEYLLKALKPEWIMGVSNFIEKIKDIDLGMYNNYRTKFEEEFDKIEDCIFEPDFPRDVFIAYSSKDMGKVTELVSFLEDENLTCFVAARNMRHGSGSVDSYNDIIHTAINNCQVLVFVSSENSRSNKCDAYKELSYIKENRGDMPRVEYIIKNYSGRAAEIFFKRFFEGHEYCTSFKDVAERVSEIIMGGVHTPEPVQDDLARKNIELQQQIEEERRKARELELKIAQSKQISVPQSTVKPNESITAESFINGKICAKCKKSNNLTAKFCTDCGNNTFFTTYDEYLGSKQKYCAVCGASNNEEDKFCAECGSNSFVFTKKERDEILAKKAEEERMRRQKEEEERKRREEEERKLRENEKRYKILNIGDFKDLGGGYVTFGVYPQSLKKDSVKIGELFSEKNNYYLGDDINAYVKLNDYYYKIEPIKWKVLSKERELLLVADDILDAHCFDGTSNNYSDSEIRRWLNDEFYKKAFTDEQKTKIITSTVDNSLLSTGNTVNNYVCEDTEDNVFLLSRYEAEKYLNEKEERKRVPTEYALAAGAQQNTDDNRSYKRGGKGCGWWLLRSPTFSFSTGVQRVTEAGDFYHNRVSYAYYGIVPAIKIRL